MLFCLNQINIALNYVKRVIRINSYIMSTLVINIDINYSIYEFNIDDN